MGDICGENRFEIIEKAKKNLLESTNIHTSEDEMKALDSFLFRCWQMGWLERYDKPREPLLFGLVINALELLVAFIQAYVFTMLSAVFIGMSRQDGH